MADWLSMVRLSSCPHYAAQYKTYMPFSEVLYQYIHTIRSSSRVESVDRAIEANKRRRRAMSTRFLPRGSGYDDDSGGGGGDGEGGGRNVDGGGRGGGLKINSPLVC